MRTLGNVLNTQREQRRKKKQATEKLRKDRWTFTEHEKRPANKLSLRDVCHSA